MIIDSYVFVGDVANSTLVISSWVSGPTYTGVSSSALKDNKVSMGRGYVSLADSAIADNVTIPVTASLDQGELLIIFEHFSSNATLVYDPLLGIDYAPLPIGLIVGLSVAGGVVLIIGIVGLIVYLRRRRSDYQSL